MVFDFIILILVSLVPIKGMLKKFSLVERKVYIPHLEFTTEQQFADNKPNVCCIFFLIRNVTYCVLCRLG